MAEYNDTANIQLLTVKNKKLKLWKITAKSKMMKLKPTMMSPLEDQKEASSLGKQHDLNVASHKGQSHKQSKWTV